MKKLLSVVLLLSCIGMQAAEVKKYNFNRNCPISREEGAQEKQEWYTFFSSFEHKEDALPKEVQAAILLGSKLYKSAVTAKYYTNTNGICSISEYYGSHPGKPYNPDERVHGYLAKLGFQPMDDSEQIIEHISKHIRAKLVPQSSCAAAGLNHDDSDGPDESSDTESSNSE